jgi:spore coat polysaccharide biosynthesis protein SpsF
MKIVVVIQARMGSSRLLGKVLLPLAGQPLLARMIERVRAATEPDALCVATSTSSADAPIRELGARLGVHVESGHPTDLLDRHYQAARATGADAVVKIPSDCPLIDPAVIDRVLGAFRAQPGAFDFVTNLQPPSWPDGNDVEVMPTSVLEAAWREAERPFEREHTTPFIWERPERFRILNVDSGLGRDLSKSHRFTIDYADDYAFIARVYEELWRPAQPLFSLAQILELVQTKPEIMELNARWAGHSWHLAHLGELRTWQPSTSVAPRPSAGSPPQKEARQCPTGSN